MIKVKKTSGVVVVLKDDDSLLLLKRPDWVDWGPSKWSFPGGKLERGETPEEGAVRETKEETTLDVYDLKSVKICLDMPVAIYYTRNFKGNVKIDFEHDDWAWVAPKDISSYDLAPQVLDAYDWVIKNG